MRIKTKMVFWWLNNCFIPIIPHQFDKSNLLFINEQHIIYLIVLNVVEHKLLSGTYSSFSNIQYSWKLNSIYRNYINIQILNVFENITKCNCQIFHCTHILFFLILNKYELIFFSLQSLVSVPIVPAFM